MDTRQPLAMQIQPVARAEVKQLCTVTGYIQYTQQHGQ